MANDGRLAGAAVERGKIISTQGGYTVESLTRSGVVTLPLETLYETAEVYAVDDMVYFFAFDDGHGAILRKIET